MTEVSYPADLTIREKIGQLFMVGFKGTELPDEIKSFLKEYNIGFVILFSRNVKSIPQVVNLTNQIHSQARISPFIYTDQEGGTVVQFKEIASTFTAHMGIAATGDKKNSEIAGKIIGEEMYACGIDGVLAPVLDVNYEQNNPIIGIRSFSDDPDMVTEFGEKFFKGLNKGGVAACGKHYPGHGGTTEDSHLEIPEHHISETDFFKTSFKPFHVISKKNIDSMIVAHIRYPKLTKNIATFSGYFINDLLRKKAGYRGIVLSDCMEMSAIKDNFSTGEIVRNSIEAGIDVIIASHNLDFQKELIENLIDFVQKGIITEKRIDESVLRIFNLKKKFNLLQARKYKEAAEAEKILRGKKETEEKIINRSITLLRNRRGIIPVNPEEKTLIVEWEKAKASVPVSKAENISMLEPCVTRYIKKPEIKILKLDGKIPEGFYEELNKYTYIIAGVYSRNPEVEKIQSSALEKIIKIRKDTVVVSMGNPYDISNIPQSDTYIVTYGFRRIQIDALFKVITGEIKPKGKLPVNIENLFKRGAGLRM